MAEYGRDRHRARRVAGIKLNLIIERSEHINTTSLLEAVLDRVHQAGDLVILPLWII